MRSRPERRRPLQAAPCVRTGASSKLSRLQRSSASEPIAVARPSRLRIALQLESDGSIAIVPVILAADSGSALGFPKALAQFGTKTALQIALENCAALAPPVVVASQKLVKLLIGGSQAMRGQPDLGNRLVVHRRGRRGQLGSLLAGLRLVPLETAFMIYAVDYPLLTAPVVRRLAEAFASRRTHQLIVLPRYRARPGHPVVFAPELRRELARAESARAVIYHDRARVKFVAVRDPSITEDFDTPTAYRRVLRRYLGRFAP